MTKKDYELIAKLLGDAYGSHADNSALTAIGNLIDEFAFALFRDNPRFDIKKFYEKLGC